MNTRKELSNMTLKNIAEICAGEYIGQKELENKVICGIETDSRRIENEYLFIPIKSSSTDGHSYIQDAFEKGAVCVISEKNLEDTKAYIKVPSTKEALKQIAAFYRQNLSIKIVGISGSVGKTSTKEMIASVISQKYSVHKNNWKS